MSAMTSLPLRFRLNGKTVLLDVEQEKRLSDILREDLGLTASKNGCGIGRCGACMVLMNRQAVNGCLVMAWQMQDAEIISPEGLDDLDIARAVKAGLVQENAFQCGYCAPGFTISLVSLLGEKPDATEADVLTALEGNICRCTGYHSIIRGALTAINQIRASHALSGED
ncbi:(2Fe-2S)-binding protein [Rhizobium sp. Root708]|uniref:(2Fe-2S)-binding protein n=1 Tax=Rhizobium sp. Root708 TaxID=1736592 RepID=UPI000AD85D31|nr:2Fe-2S iron-sulfur cluster-binding protein [Rhizobium sp. Root708]